MTFNWSEISIPRGYGEYGIAFNAHSLHLVTLSLASGSSFVIGNFTKPEHFPLHHFEKVVASLEQKAREIAAVENCDRFMDEALSYVRLMLSRSEDMIWDLEDPDWLQLVKEDISIGLRTALMQTDVYRAARQFETCVRALEADIEIIDLMSPILATFNADTNSQLGHWVELAAQREETRLRSGSQFLSSAIDRLFDNDRPALIGRR